MGMSQIGREHRQALFDINTGSVPMQKRGYRKSVAKVMNAWAEAIPDFSEADLAGEFDECPSDHAVGERCTLIGQEKAGCDRSGVKLIASLKIQFKFFHGGRMQGDQAGLVELGQPNSQEHLIKINVATLKVNDLTDPHSGNGHQAKEGVKGPGA
jgi:hypothetical protein